MLKIIVIAYYEFLRRIVSFILIEIFTHLYIYAYVGIINI